MENSRTAKQAARQQFENWCKMGGRFPLERRGLSEVYADPETCRAWNIWCAVLDSAGVRELQGYDVRPFDKMTDDQAAHVQEWLTANQKEPADVRWSLYPIGMMQRWIERAIEAEKALALAHAKEGL